MSRRKAAAGVSRTFVVETPPPDYRYEVRRTDYRSLGAGASKVLDEMWAPSRDLLLPFVSETEASFVLKLPDVIEPGSELAYAVHDFLAGMFGWTVDMKAGGEIKGNRLVNAWADKRNRWDEKYIKGT